jgi:hypothetical protein
MRTFRSALHIMLALAILSTGLPLYQSGDMNRDGRIGLSDAIVSVRQLVDRATVGDASFRGGMENTLNSLSVAAGLKSVIRTAREPVSATGALAIAALTMDSYQFELLTPLPFAPADQAFLYNPPALVPLDPPPNSVLA